MSWIEDLARNLTQGRKNRAAGTVVVIDFLPPEELQALQEPLQDAMGREWGVHLVGDPTRRTGAISADQAVDLREDLGRRSFFLVIRDEAGAGLQGVYDVAEVLAEPDILHRLRTAVRNDLRRQNRDLEAAAWNACRIARTKHGTAEQFYRREIEFFDALRVSPTFETAGRHLPLLGLIPDVALVVERLERNAQAVRELLRVDSGTFVSHSERVRRLRLQNSDVESGVAKVLEGAPSLFALEEWLPKLYERGFTFDRWTREAELAELDSLELVAWRPPGQKPYKWTGLDEHPDFGLYFSLADESANDVLELRWKTIPADLPRGAVEYRLQLLPVEGDEPLLQDHSAHRAVKGGLQKWQIPRERLQELAQGMTARLQVSVLGREDLPPVETEDFLLTTSLIPERREADTSAKPVRSRWDLVLENVRSGGSPRQPSLSVRGDVVELHLDRLRRRLDVPELLARLEADLLQRNQDPGIYRAGLRPDGSVEQFEPSEDYLPTGKAWETFLNARGRLFRKFRKELQPEEEGTTKLPLLVEALDLSQYEGDIWEYARSYGQLLDSLAQALPSDGREPLATALAVDSLTLRDARGSLHSRLLAPTHPLRLLWLLAYATLMEHWSRELVSMRTPERGKAAPREDIERLSSHLFPAFLASSEGGLWAYSDGIGLYWAILTPLGSRDTQQRVADLLNALKLRGDRSALAFMSANLVRDRILDFLDTHPYVQTLQVNALEPGDASFLTRTLIEVRRQRDPEQGMSPRLDLRLCARHADSQPGRYLDQLALARRKNQPLTEDEMRLFRSTGRSTSPGLQWAHVQDLNRLPTAHLCLLTDYFDGVPCAAPVEGPLKTPEVYGLSLPMLLDYSKEQGQLTWRRWVNPVAGETSQRHPARPAFTDWLATTHRAILRAAARLADSLSDAILPGVALVLTDDQQRDLQTLHAKSDWVVTLDRYLGPEYFDQPDESGESLFSKFLLDYVPGQLDGTAHRLLLSTSRSEEIQRFLRIGLENMGFAPSVAALGPLLLHLKALSGRVALHLGGPRSTVAEALALATLHRHASLRGQLGAALLLPLDSLLPPSKNGGRPCPLLLKVELSRQRRRETLDFEVTAVDFAFDPSQALSVNLRSELLAAADDALTRLQQEFGLSPDDAEPSSRAGTSQRPLTLPVRRRRLGRVLRSFMEKARRYGTLGEEEAAPLARRLDELTDPAFARLGEVRTAAAVVCPRLRGEGERVIDEPRGRVLILGAAAWPELFGERISEILSVSDAAPDSGESAPDLEHPTEPTSRVLPMRDGIPAPGQPSTHTASENVAIMLGRDVVRGREVAFSLSVRSNPHLLLVGIPGTGKSTAIVNISQALARQGVQPLIFDFHGDLTQRLQTQLDDLRVLNGSQGLEFNPLRLSRRQAEKPGGWVDSAFEVTEIFGSVFPELGDLQQADIRARLIRSYQEAGFREGEAVEGVAAPAFRRFYDAMREDPKPSTRSQHVLARLDTMFLRNLFRPSDYEIGVEELMERPTALDLHEVSGEQNQLAAASFFLHKVYKDMFERGESDRLRLAIIFDEAHRAARLQLLGTMMQESRKFGIMMVVSSQRASDFHARVLESTGNFLLLKVNPPDARTLAPLLAGYEGKDAVIRKLVDQRSYHALFRSEGWKPYVEVALREA